MGFTLTPDAGKSTYLSGAFAFDAVETEPLSGTVNDLSVSSAQSVSAILINATANFVITGIAGGTANRQLELVNQTGFSGTITANGAGSLPANRLASGATLPSGTTLQLVYNANLNLWCVAASSSSGGTGITSVSGTAPITANTAGTAVTIGINPPGNNNDVLLKSGAGIAASDELSYDIVTHTMQVGDVGLPCIIQNSGNEISLVAGSGSAKIITSGINFEVGTNNVFLNVNNNGLTVFDIINYSSQPNAGAGIGFSINDPFDFVIAHFNASFTGPYLIGGPAGPQDVIASGRVLSIGVGGTQAMLIDTAENVTLNAGLAFTAVDYQTPATGFTITIADSTLALNLDPAGTLATGTINLPATPIDGQIIEVASTQTVTALTVSAAGKTLKNAPTTLVAGSGFSYRYRLSTTTWYRQY